MNNLKGILLVDKQKDKTSFSIIHILRKVLNVKKIGHSGTLDPFATGLMVILIGKEYTTLSDKFINFKKEYIGKLHLGYTTETFDSESELNKVSDHVPVILEIEKTIEKFKGSIEQIPPMYSAKKINGQKLYNLARKGISIERDPIKVEVEIEILNYAYPYLEIKINCSKGTYIRTLANDIGRHLKTGAYLKELRRTKVGPFNVDDSLKQDTQLLKELILQKLILKTL